MREKSKFCQYYYGDMRSTTFPDIRVALPLRHYWFSLKKFVWVAGVLGIQGAIPRYFTIQFGKSNMMKNKKTTREMTGQILNLKPGDWIEVRPAKEIFATLDTRGKLRGLTFTPEMTKFCGKKFKVYKKLNQIILEATGELRKMRSPTVLLEGVFCDGKAHGDCDRSCFCFWREEWLLRTNSPPEK
jgi:hypothetical protein